MSIVTDTAPRLESTKGNRMLTRIHVNQHNIRANGKAGNSDLPVITVKDYKQNRKGHTASVVDNGREVCRVVYSPEKPLPCGAKVWIETSLEVRVD